MKLTEIALSLADILICIPSEQIPRQLMRVRPEEVLGHLTQYLTQFRGGNNPGLDLLKEKLTIFSGAHSIGMAVYDHQHFSLNEDDAEIAESDVIAVR